MAPLITIVEKQVVWVVGLIRSNKSFSFKIYGQKQDAIDEFTKCIKRVLREDATIDEIDYETALGVANKCYQYLEGEDIAVITLDSDVVN